MNNKICIEYFETPVGELILGVFNDQLCLADWRYRKMRTAIDKRIQKFLAAQYVEESHPLIDETRKQLSEYFNKERTEFDLPLAFAGSDFQKMVWNALCTIPYGSTDTYMNLSVKLKNEKAIRAVASANGANAISIIVPCHRIIGSDGSLVGYAGGVSAKKKLLQLEGTLQDNQLNLF